MKPAAPVTTIIISLYGCEGRKFQKALARLFPVFCLFYLISCGHPQSKEPSSQEKAITDPLGNKAIVKSGPLRVMGLSPAMTEMLFALLPDSAIIGLTPHCNFPSEKVKKKPAVSVMPLDFEKLLSLHPDLIFTEEGITSEGDLHRLRELGLQVVAFRYRRVADVLAAMDSIRIWTNAGQQATTFCDSLRKELQVLEEAIRSKPANLRPKILAITWTNPIFAYGYDTWMSDKMRLAGGENVLRKSLGKPYPVLEREDVLQLNPDLLFGGSFEKLDKDFFRLYPELKQITAYRNKQIFELNDDLASRPGPRFLEGIREMASFLKPDSARCR